MDHNDTLEDQIYTAMCAGEPLDAFPAQAVDGVLGQLAKAASDAAKRAAKSQAAQDLKKKAMEQGKKAGSAALEKAQEGAVELGKKGLDLSAQGVRFLNDVWALSRRLAVLNTYVKDKGTAEVSKNAERFWSVKMSAPERIDRLRDALYQQLSMSGDEILALSKLKGVDQAVKLFGGATSAISSNVADSDDHDALRKAMRDLAARSDKMESAAKMAVGMMIAASKDRDSIEWLNRNGLKAFFSRDSAQEVRAELVRAMPQATDAEIDAALLLLVDAPVPSGIKQLAADEYLVENMYASDQYVMGPHCMRVVPLLGASAERDAPAQFAIVRQRFGEERRTLSNQDMARMRGEFELRARRALMQTSGDFLHQLEQRQFSLDLSPIDPSTVHGTAVSTELLSTLGVSTSVAQ
jgi:hypothetical protein